MNTSEVVRLVNVEWDSASMKEIATKVEGVLEVRLGGGQIDLNTIINQTNHILSQMIASTNDSNDWRKLAVYAAAGVQVVSLYVRPKQSYGVATNGNDLDSLPWGIDMTKEKLLEMFLKSVEEDFGIIILD